MLENCGLELCPKSPWRSYAQMRSVNSVDDEKSFWFILRVRQKSEDRVASKLNKRFEIMGKLDDNVCYEAFVPRFYRARTKNGAVHEKELLTCYPGYVFVSGYKSADEARPEIMSAISGINEAHFFLYYDDNKREIAMRSEERDLISRLMNSEHIIESSLGYMDGDFIRIISGPLKGMEGQIIKVKKSSRSATLKAKIFSQSIEVTVMLEHAEKAEF